MLYDPSSKMQTSRPDPAREGGDAPRRSPLTVEMALWALVLAIALALRLLNLDAAPLSAPEAREALAAWRAVSHGELPASGYSPLLFTGNVILFSIFSPSDGMARLWPVVFGAALALTPLLLRRRIGRVGALAVGLYLAFSPSTLFASRQLEGTVVVMAGGMAFLGSLIRFFDTGNRRRWLIFAGCGLALAVTAVPSAWGFVIALALTCLSVRWSEGGIARWWRAARPYWRCGVFAFLLTVLAVASGVGYNAPGVGATGDLLAVWFGGAGQISPLPLLLLGVYEPLALIFALGGLVCSIRRQHQFGLFLGVWSLLSLFLVVFVPGQQPVAYAWIIVPLILLGGIGVEALARRWRDFRKWNWPALTTYILIALALWVYVYLRIARYSMPYGKVGDLLLGVFAFGFPALILLAVEALVVVWQNPDRPAGAGLSMGETMMDEMMAGSRTVLRGAMMGTLVMLSALTISLGWGVAHVRPADARELLVAQSTTAEVRRLVQTLRDISWRETGIPTTLPFEYRAASDSVLAWYLRDFSAARRVDPTEAIDQTQPVLVTESKDWPFDAAAAAGEADNVPFRGQDFPLQRDWDPWSLSCVWRWPPCKAFYRWALLRETAVDPEATHWAVLWLSTEAEMSYISHSH